MSQLKVLVCDGGAERRNTNWTQVAQDNLSKIKLEYHPKFPDIVSKYDILVLHYTDFDENLSGSLYCLKNLFCLLDGVYRREVEDKENQWYKWGQQFKHILIFTLAGFSTEVREAFDSYNLESHQLDYFTHDDEVKQKILEMGGIHIRMECWLEFAERLHLNAFREKTHQVLLDDCLKRLGRFIDSADDTTEKKLLSEIEHHWQLLTQNPEQSSQQMQMEKIVEILEWLSRKERESIFKNLEDYL